MTTSEDLISAARSSSKGLAKNLGNSIGSNPTAAILPSKRRGPAVLTPVVLEQAQQLLDEGLESPEVADRLGIKRDTLRKAVKKNLSS